MESKRSASNRSLNSRAHFENALHVAPLKLSFSSRENWTPALPPSTIDNMLRNTTEVGDLELFSVKSRLPRPPAASIGVHSARKLAAEYLNDLTHCIEQEICCPSGPTGEDDRKCLPSYTRDTTSEIISMYETSSQKADKLNLYEDPENRAFSMNQTVRPLNTISNHRSFASLRSQPEFSLPQRPRSPFSYPTRLKRPGFRPWSPEFTDGSGIDYTRRAEIERSKTTLPHNTSLPFTLYAQKRFIPSLSIRSDANRSNPSLHDSSPPRRLILSQRTPTNDSLHERRNQPESAFVNASPARSTLSLASTTNLYRQGALVSTTITPANQAPSSPLYYDYTEDFEAEQVPKAHESVERPPPALFLVDRTIHEDKELSSERSSLNDSLVLVQGGPSRSQDQITIPDGDTPSSQGDWEAKASDFMSKSLVKDILSLYPKSVSNKISPATINKAAHGCQIQLIDAHIQSAQPDLQEEQPDSNHAPCFQDDVKLARNDQDDTIDSETVSNHSSFFSLSSHLPTFPRPPERQVHINTDPATAARSQRGLIMGLKEVRQTEEKREFALRRGRSAAIGTTFSGSDNKPKSTSAFVQKHAAQADPFEPHLAEIRSVCSNRFVSVDQGLTDRAELITSFEDADPPVADGTILRPPCCLMKVLPDVPEESFIHAECEPHSALGNFRSDPDLRTLTGILRDTNVLTPLLVPNEEPVWSNRLRNEAYQFSQNHQLRSDPLILSPKLISPGMKLRAKINVPELMKALPPLPQALHSTNRQPNNTSVQFQPSPLVSEFEMQGKSDDQNIAVTSPFEFDAGLIENLSPPSEPTCEPVSCRDVNNIESMPKTPSRIKLKSKILVENAFLPRHSRPRKSDGKYLSAGAQPLQHPSTLGTRDHAERPLPKLKLKVRNNSSSLLGTVNVNSHARGQFSLSSVDLRHPKDLFTTTNSLTDRFWQVGSHFHLAKISNTSTEQLVSESQGPDCHTESHSANPLDSRSFWSDNNSQIQYSSGSRKRMSNFRNRMPDLYIGRIVPHSYDDVVWRERNAEGGASLFPLRTSGANSNILRKGETRVSIFEVRHQVKTKVSKWFKGAKSVVTKALHSKSNSEV